MDNNTAQMVAALTTRFYAAVADSFSETRANAWAGWRQVLDLAASEAARPLDVLDVACGNMRFERFLQESGAIVRSVRAIDNCTRLVESGTQGGDSGSGAHARFSFPLGFHKADILRALGATGAVACAMGGSGQGEGGSAGSAAPPFLFGEDDRSLSVCFGFMHHVPLSEQRLCLLEQLIRATRPGGIVAVSFWQFAKSERLLARARETTERALEAYPISFEDGNDFLLGWKDEQNVFRYCHNYTESEIDSLIGAASRACASERRSVKQIARFSADGAEGNLNRYVVLKVEGL